MKYISEYRDPKLAKHFVDEINRATTKDISLMEVCGTHTVAISKAGIRGVLPKKLTLISGPGCPVCVTANADIDRGIAFAQLPNVIFTTFGDMMKVPGSYTTLSKERADGRDIRVCYSTLDALKIARDNPERQVIFFGVGFETTTPTIALSIQQAASEGLKNYSVYARHKIVPPAMIALMGLGEVRLDGFLCPGHVSAIIGTHPYEPIAAAGAPCVIVGFEPLDILEGILMLVKQVEEGRSEVENQYTRTVRPDGNVAAQQVMAEVFRICDADWRGIGVIPGTGQCLNDKYAEFDADKRFEIEVPPTKEPKGCQCGEVLRGVTVPYDCRLFGKACTPEHPVGPCMVSAEGSCAAYYRYDARVAEKV